MIAWTLQKFFLLIALCREISILKLMASLLTSASTGIWKLKFNPLRCSRGIFNQLWLGACTSPFFKINVMARTNKSRVQAYIKKHPRCSLMDLVFKGKVVTSNYLFEHVICTSCGHVEDKSTYSIAQKAMGHSMTFNCNCGNKIKL
jgi:hypothetical protein